MVSDGLTRPREAMVSDGWSDPVNGKWWLLSPSEAIVSGGLIRPSEATVSGRLIRPSEAMVSGGLIRPSEVMVSGG